jgi:hypothetical protein
MTGGSSKATQPIEIGVYAIPLQLDSALEPQRASLERLLLAAQRRLKDFALKQHWNEYIQEPFAESVHFYAGKAAFDHDFVKVFSLDPALEIPKTFCAMLEQGVLRSVSPELYRSAYPEGDEEDAFEKLLAHEMAHRLHIRILHGNEEAMGPVWFYEGFALYAAGQLEKTATLLKTADLWAVVASDERQDYRRYVTVLQYFLRKTSLHALVDRAGRNDFVKWLEQFSE